MPNYRLVFAEKFNLKRRTTQNAGKMVVKAWIWSPQNPHKHLHKTEIMLKKQATLSYSEETNVRHGHIFS